jgi:hypothetical protein
VKRRWQVLEREASVVGAGAWSVGVMILTVADRWSVERRCNNTDSGRSLECGATV